MLEHAAEQLLLAQPDVQSEAQPDAKSEAGHLRFEEGSRMYVAVTPADAEVRARGGAGE